MQTSQIPILLSKLLGFIIFVCMEVMQTDAKVIKKDTHVHIMEMIIGDRTTNLGYNVMGPAYDVAWTGAQNRFPRVFDHCTVTRYFVPGTGLDCRASAGLLTEGFYRLLANTTNTPSLSEQNDFRIVLSPGVSHSYF